METTVTFEDEMYYSLNDIAKLTDLPKDLKRNERIDYITKEIETRTAKLQQELHEIVKSL